MQQLTKGIALGVALAILAVAGGCSKSDISKSSQVLARVGDKEITTSYFERQLGSLPESVRKASTNGEGKKAILEGMVNREIIYADALRKKIDEKADVQKQLEDSKKELIVNAYLEKEIAGKVKVTEKDAEAYYNSNPGEYKNREEIRISQIVVPDQAKAEDILKKLGIRRDFGELAETFSTDRISAVMKGDVGWFTYQRLPKEVRDDVFKLGVGQVSKPHKMSNGYEIYKVTDRKVTSYPYEKVNEVIKLQLYKEKFQNELKGLVDVLKKETPVQINEALLR